MATTTKKLDDLLREMCEQLGLPPSDDAAETGVFRIEDMLVAVDLTEDAACLDIRVLMETDQKVLDDVHLLRQLAYHAYDAQGDRAAIRFGALRETGQAMAMAQVPIEEVTTGADLLWVLEMSCELAQDGFSELCALALAEFAAEQMEDAPGSDPLSLPAGEPALV